MTLNKFLHRVWMLAFVAWREARGESTDGVIAVMYTVKERADNLKAWEGTDIVSAITAKWQYSSITDPNDPQLTKFPQESDSYFPQFMDLAAAVLTESIPNPVPGADSYYAVSMPHPPNWATAERFLKQIGGHRFYKVI